MKTVFERERFSERLKKALKSSHYSANSPTELAREFNERYDGNPITVHAARKWLHGEAIPTQEKIRIISTWLGISTEWLRFGSESAHLAPKPGGTFETIPDEEGLAADWHQLDEHHRKLAREFIQIMIKVQRS